MKNFMHFLLILLSLNIVTAQNENFTVEVSADSILLGNSFEVKFQIENADVKDFEPPLFENFDVVGGPNQSTSMSMMNGQTSSSTSFGYVLQPREVGSFYIAPASAMIDGQIQETTPVEIHVLPNPGGIRQSSRLRKQHEFNFFRDADDFFNQDFPDWEPQPKSDKQPSKKKKKFKTYKI